MRSSSLLFEIVSVANCKLPNIRILPGAQPKNLFCRYLPFLVFPSLKLAGSKVNQVDIPPLIIEQKVFFQYQ